MEQSFFSFNIRIFLAAATVALGSCSREAPEDKMDVIRSGFPELSLPVVERDFNALQDAAENSDSYVSGMAWRAMAKSTPEDLDEFLEKVIELDEHGGWYALSLQTLDDSQIERVEDAFFGDPAEAESESVCEVFYRAGNVRTLNHLMRNPETLAGYERCALAVGGILTRETVADSIKSRIVSYAFESDSRTGRRNLLYGFYRNELNRPEPGSFLAGEMSRLWDAFGVGRDPVLDQYMVRILGEQGFIKVMRHRDDETLYGEVQLSVELARALQFSALENTGTGNVVRLLRHENPNVVAETLEALRQRERIGEELTKFIEEEITRSANRDEPFLISLILLEKQGVNIRDENYLRRLETIRLQNPYLTDKVLAIYEMLETRDVFLERIGAGLEKGGIEGMHAARALTDYWAQHGDSDIRETTRIFIHEALETGNRSVISGLGSLLTDENMIGEDDFSWLNRVYIDFLNAGAEENAFELEQVLEQRFPERFEKHPSERDPDFRIPDWERLEELGPQPVWTLETEKGTIELQLDPLSAPFTVSSIDSLTRAGSYDGVVFHRIVNNFVIQGGDFDRRDGFGGPDYTLPTEPSYESFERGMAGIASSGTDTEGSQFFIMHQWAPHLDGHYTLFGKVVGGMDVVDRIAVGDRVIRSRIGVGNSK